MLHAGCHAEHNHACQFLWRSVKGFWCGEGSNFGLFHWLASRASVWCPHFCHFGCQFYYRSHTADTGSVYVYHEVANSVKKCSPYRKTRVVCRHERNILSGAFEFPIYTKLYLVEDCELCYTNALKYNLLIPHVGKVDGTGSHTFTALCIYGEWVSE